MKPLPSLDQLRRERSSPFSRRDLLLRLQTALLPAALLTGFAVITLILYGNRLLPAREVQIRQVLPRPVTALETAASPGAPAGHLDELPPGPVTFQPPSQPGPVLFQASGWIEPDPLPIKVTALVDGVVDEVHVLEGATVAKGRLLATLIDDDARLAVSAAENALAETVAAAAAHEASIAVAEARRLQSTAALEAERARLEELLDTQSRLENLDPGAVSENALVGAQKAALAQSATVEASMAALTASEADLYRLAVLHDEFDARTGSARVALEQAELALERTRIHAPVDGIILRLLVAPGQKRMLGMDDPDSSTIAILFEPGRLQVRVDVPLADAAGLAAGQPVRITCQALPDQPLWGAVTRIAGEADLQRNTLQAKVRILDPPAVLRPEMLSRAEFFALPSPQHAPNNPTQDQESPTTTVLLFVPQAAVIDRDPQSGVAAVWTCNPEKPRAERREIRVGNEKLQDHLLVLSGLHAGEWVVLSPPSALRTGDRLRPQSMEP
ncbi:MAG TPA: HlyD family efflux transporter periplasmic adaptor subunit [Verrucomicrobiales bacterium]|nr:HlyD family efflux transporter periplasmic adaptor subunit [Verrucomicrobiales bacterium]